MKPLAPARRPATPGNVPAETPAALGYRMPAEWESHQATWLSWPHNLETWDPDRLPRVERTFAQAVAALSRSETVHLNVLDAAHERHVCPLLEAAAAQTEAVRFHHIRTNDAWCRDHGAVFITREADGRRELAALDWGYNAWGGKYPPWDADAAVPRRMAAYLDVPRFEPGLVLEGGSVEPNGAGLVLTTESCLLNPNRNPGRTRAEIVQHLRDYLGAAQVLWLGDGIVGDDTDGHVDDITRFVAEDAVITAVEADPQDENYAPLQENLERLRAVRMPDGRPLRIHTLPMPAPVVQDGLRLPASYANFYVANRVVLLPVFDDRNDAVAMATLQQLFPGRRVVGLDARDVVWGLGAWHCLTQQVPATG
jgi:agmatine deiminase